MKKIMFNTPLGLHDDVVSGYKTKTRRICKEQYWSFSDLVNANSNQSYMFDIPTYGIGEVVAIAQPYKDFMSPDDERGWADKEHTKRVPGWVNKMFVKAEYMPLRIRIIDIKVERLQEISDEDCLKEGIHKWTKDMELCKYDLGEGHEMWHWCDKPREPKEVFRKLIDKISGKGTWKSNPYVFVYEFELVKE